ncbi:MAG: hypothetical protein IPK13_23425 [Deltaproteobacteria bacterium]|nr:hypothetical protein [Deltaproteobacteria bacterium]
MSNAPKTDKLQILDLMEGYVLAAIRELRPGDEARIARTVSERLGPGDWPTLVRELFGLQAAVDEQLRVMWDEAQIVAGRQGHKLESQDFAKLVVEENFADAVEMVTSELDHGSTKRRGPKKQRPKDPSV